MLTYLWLYLFSMLHSEPRQQDHEQHRQKHDHEIQNDPFQSASEIDSDVSVSSVLTVIETVVDPCGVIQV